jgi:hypothetical protein
VFSQALALLFLTEARIELVVSLPASEDAPWNPHRSAGLPLIDLSAVAVRCPSYWTIAWFEA